MNLSTAGIALLVGAGNYTLNWGDYTFAGIALGTLAAVVIYQVLRPLSAVPLPWPESQTRRPDERLGVLPPGQRRRSTSSPLKLPSTSSSTPSSARMYA